jgi:hypothetical protein
MNKTSKHFIGLLFCVFLVSAAYSLRLGGVNQGQTYIEEGTQIRYSVHNKGAESIDSARVTFWIPELDYYENLGTMRIGSHKTRNSISTVDLSGIKPGEYLARVNIKSGHASDSKWIMVNVD